MEILKNICYTELVYGRINKKLGVDFSKKQSEEFIFKALKSTHSGSKEKTKDDSKNKHYDYLNNN